MHQSISGLNYLEVHTHVTYLIIYLYGILTMMIILLLVIGKMLNLPLGKYLKLNNINQQLKFVKQV